MKVCEICGVEISTKDGDGRCTAHEDVSRVSKKARRQRSSRDEVMRSLGLVKVRGAMGGTYWE